MQTKQQGFTLIELVIVIVILGILAATALPKFIDFKDDAGAAAVAGVAGGLASASAINYSGRALSKTVTPGTLSDTAAKVCKDTVLGDLLTSGWPAGYKVADAGTTRTCGAQGAVDCAVTESTTSKSATAGLTCYN